jgi:hypothetical protein
MIQIDFYEKGKGFIKQWPNWSGVVPSVGDEVVLHFGDDNEEERRCVVRFRTIDGTKPDRIKLGIKWVHY